MRLNELFDKEGIEVVSQKTNISVENLKNLYEENFAKLNRVKALGFLKIFEREYKDIELEELREALKSYYEEHKEAKDDEVVMVSQHMKEERGSSSELLKWLIIGGVLYGAWYFYSTGKFGSFDSKSSDGESQLNDVNALKSHVSESIAENVIIRNDDNGTTIEIETKAIPIKQSDEPLEESTEKVVLNETNATLERLTPSDENGTTMDVIAAEISKEANETQAASDSNTSGMIDNLTINPTRGMLWFGFINIETKERRQFMTKVSTPFEVSGGKWTLVTGHGYVDIVSDAKTIEHSDRLKHYFYIDGQEIREIDNKEFRKLNGGKGW